MSGTSHASGAAKTELPSFTATQFDLRDAPECDLIMKGGITSGIVYPYAVLQIATRYRLRSIGGTSAGAIAAAFAAAAEFARLNGHPEGFLILKGYCDELPERLSTLFQPTPELAPAFETAKSAIATTRIPDVVRIVARHAAPGALAGAGMTGLPFFFLQPSPWVTGLAAALGLVIGGGAKAAHWSFFRIWRPLTKAARDLRTNTFGACTGLTMPGHVEPALTDWIHRALQHIAFGDPDHAEPLTFGHLRGPDPDRPSIDLKMVTTNLSMRRPHTLPRLGIRAGFIPDDWEQLFARPVMDWLQSVGTRPWQRYAGAWQFPREESLPVVVAVRMSLSFPMLFSAVPLKVDDIAFSSIVHSLGGKPRRRIVTALFSDGGISSNFPVHMFDALLPRRPTFAFSLEELPVGEEEVTSRVALPTDARQGMGVHVEEIGSFGDFGWGVLNSAKDWQDQLLSEITGQRERVARIYLTRHEGGLNLDMKPEVSRRLMLLGYEAGCKFTDGDFDFDEHRWRRTLVLYRHLHDSLEHIDQAWSDGFAEWYAGYARRARSFKTIPKHDRDRIARNIDRLLECWNTIEDREIGSQDRFPKKIGRFRIGPDY